MNVLNNSGDELPECPLCMEPLEVDDLSFFPCTCGYQICRFCWHRIRTDENELCPACRKAYPENPADFKPLTQEQISALKAEKRQRDQQRKQKITENRKHLANVRVVQKNLVFVVGLPPRLADAEILKKHEYFGKYGKIHKVVINPSTTYAGVQGPSASAYVTYVHNNDALRAIQSVNNITIDGRSIKTSLGTTKYCSHFMKNQVCPKPDCMYLHELGDPEASFTKEEMHQGKHQEYEKRLHDSLIAQMQQQSQQSATGSSNPATSSPISITGNSASSNGILNNIEESKDNVSSGCNNNGAANNNDQIQKEVWPSLSTSPVTIKENKGNVKGHQKEMSKNEVNSTRKHEKVKGEKSKDNNKHHQKTSSSFSSTSTNGNGSSSKENRLQSNNHNIEDDSNETDSDDSPSISSNSTDSCNVSESDSVKSSPPSSFPDPIVLHHRSNNNKKSTNYNSLTIEKISVKNEQQQQQQNSIINANDITKPLYSPSNDKIIKDSENLPDMSDHSQAMSSAQLPDLLNGTVNNNNIGMGIDAKQLLKNLGSFGNNESSNHDDWENAFKYLMSKNNFNCKQTNYDDNQQEDWLQYQELRKQTSNFHNGSSHFNMFNNDNSVDNIFSQNEMNRMMINNHQQQQQQQFSHQHRVNQNNSDMNLVHTNMSKFFDFHKQQQQQSHFMLNSNPISDVANLSENHRISTNYVEQSNGLSHLQKQRLLGKYDGSNIPCKASNQNRMHQNPPQFSVEDDLGFDPIKESHKGLSELINDEVLQAQQQLISSQRSRMAPPPGFNHLQQNNYGNCSVPTASPRIQSGSKFPFVNMQSQQSQQQNSWPIHMNYQNNSDGFSHHPNNLHKAADWTSLDPAIVSFRQFSQFNSQTPQPAHQNHNDIFMSQLNQQGFSHHGMNINQSSSAQVFPHSNVINNYSMNNNLHNGFQNSNYDAKFTMPSIPPPGFQQSNSNSKKSECIN